VESIAVVYRQDHNTYRTYITFNNGKININGRWKEHVLRLSSQVIWRHVPECNTGYNAIHISVSGCNNDDSINSADDADVTASEITNKAKEKSRRNA
jgi:hypothetical protein